MADRFFGEVDQIGPAARSVAKRAIDVLVSGLLLAIVSPVLLIIALSVLLSSRGPVIFRQNRGGLKAKPFAVMKFRTMYVVEDGDHVRSAVRGDRRVTPVGSFLRATSLDELPQLVNVLLGDMSLVGPRPHALVHDEVYGDALDSYCRRFAVRPGITGLAQVRGLRGEIRTLDCIKSRLSADCEYIEGWTLKSDVSILLRTLPLLVRDHNAY
ncbi:sugar transferase [Sphingomonas bacterium]|uniref:sugar transferase n=1 Tax=Sphingomonas bacterium TaxID=1895847 RepID=UPI0020C73CE6|nr:sugar transferase [Sphingomonas bacterium]